MSPLRSRSAARRCFLVLVGSGFLRLGLAYQASASACCSWPDRSSLRAAEAAAPARDSASIRARPACRAASIPQSIRRSEPAVRRRCLPSPAARRHLRPRVCHPDVAARHRLRRRRGARGNACGPDGRPPFRSSRDDRRSARNRNGAPAGDRCPARISPAGRRGRSDRRRRAPATAPARSPRNPRSASCRRAVRP